MESLIGQALQAGVRAARQLVTSAADRCGPDHVAEILEEFEERRNSAGWTPDTLALRLKNATPTVGPSDGWPAPAQRQGADTKAAELQRLEACWGAEIDLMPAADLVELAREALSGTARQLFRMSLESKRPDRTDPSIREQLLRHLEENGGR